MRNQSFESHFYYWILPSFFIVTVALLYFTGIPLLQTIIAPDINREYGFLETSQHLIIVGVIGMAVYGFRQSKGGLERIGFLLATLLASIQLMEELNWGQHYLRALGFAPAQSKVGPWSLHNQEGVSTPLKRVGDAVIFLYFFLFPLIVSQRWPAWLRYLAPQRMLVLTVLSSVLVTKFFHFVSDNSPVNNKAFINGVSEFRETYIYYFVFLYVRELAVNRRWPGFRAGGVSIQKEKAADARPG